MPKAVSGSQMIDLTNPGARVDIPGLVGIDLLSVTIPAAVLMGSAVVELKRGPSLSSYDTPKTITASTPAIFGADVDGLDSAAVVVTTHATAAGSVRVEWFGEETQ